MLKETAAKKGAKRGLHDSLKKWPFIFLAPFLLSYAAFFVFPIGYSFYISLNKWTIGEKMQFIGLKNYIDLFTKDPYFLKSVYNTFIIMIITIPIVMCLGLLLSELLFNEDMKARNFFQTANYLPYITTPVAIAIIFSMMFDAKIGAVNIFLIKIGILKEGIDWMTAAPILQRTVLITMLVWQQTGYYMLMYLAGMTSISSEIYEAARVDGASRWQTFRKVTVPMLNNVTYFLIITSVIYMLQLMDQPFLLLRGVSQGAARTIEKPLMTVLTNFYEQSVQNGRFGHGAAITFGLFFIILVITFIGMSLLKKVGGETYED